MQLLTARLLLRTPAFTDEKELHFFQQRNRDHLAKWESTTGEKSYPLEKWIEEEKEQKSIRFLLFFEKKLIGLCSFTQIFRGAFQACYLGFKIDQEYEGQGLMKEALESAIQHIFEVERLHRIMANYMPENTRSAKLLESLGFEIEGFAKNYLLINGKWEDHVLTSRSSL